MIDALPNEFFHEVGRRLLSSMLRFDDNRVDWRSPFVAAIQCRLLIAPVSFRLPAEVFGAFVVPRTQTAPVYLSQLDRFGGQPELAMDWSLSRSHVAEYEQLRVEPVDQAMYAADASWLVLLTDAYAVAGFTAEAVRNEFARAAGALSEPDAVVAELRNEFESSRATPAERSQTVALLGHVYGPSVAAKLV